MNTYYPPTTHRLGAFRVVVTQMGGAAYRASVMIGSGSRHGSDDVSQTPAREMMGAGEYRAWIGGE